MMQRAGKPERHIQVVADATTRALAALQMIDDWHDAASDLANGTETLAASGFFEWNGDRPVTEERVREFLDPSRMRRFLSCTLELLNSAIRGLESVAEPILVFDAEQLKSRFLRDVHVDRQSENRQREIESCKIET